MADNLDGEWEIRFRYQWNMARMKLLGPRKWAELQEIEFKKKTVDQRRAELSYKSR